MRSDLRSENEVMQYRSRFTVLPAQEGVDPMKRVMQLVSDWHKHRESCRTRRGHCGRSWVDIERECVSIELGELSQPAGYVGGQPEGDDFVAASRRLDDDRGLRYWAFEMDELDVKWSLRRWHTCIGMSRSQDGTALVNIRNSYYMLPEYLGAAPAAFRFTIPGIVRSVLSDPSLEVWCGSDRVHMQPLAIDADTFPSWIERLWAPDRQLPFILVVSDWDGALPIDNIQELCRAAMGMANVYVMDGSDKHLMCDIVKPYFGRNTPYHDFRISDGFVRVYPGGIDKRTRQDALRCRFYFSSQIEHDFEFESQLFKEINRSICGASYRGPDDVVDLDDIARKDAKLRVRILTERSEQLKRKLSEVRETSREHVRSDDAADEMKYLDSENAKLRNALGEWEQLACSYSEQVDALSVENNDLMSQVAALASECNRKVGWLPPSKADGANAPLLGMRHVPSCLLDLLDLVAASWPDRVAVLEDARRSAGRFRCDLDEAWAILRSIPTVLWDLSFNGAVGDIEEAYRTEAGYTLARTETRVTKDNPQMMRERTHTYDGREVTMLAHIKGRSKNPKKAFRVYYFPDSARKMIVIGHCGGHLTTDGTRRKGF